CFMKNLGEILASPTLHPSIEKTMLDGQAEPQPDHNPSCVAAEKSGRRLARAWSKVCDQTGCGGLSVVEQLASLALPSIRRTTSRPTSDKALKRSLSRAEPKDAMGRAAEEMATLSLHFLDGVPRCPNQTT